MEKCSVLNVKPPSLGESLPDNADRGSTNGVVGEDMGGLLHTSLSTYLYGDINTGSAPGHRHLQLPADLTRYLNIF